ncbi:hypothetical protein WOLCODRAFT_17732 [Wolfiporia cocos MD-104 SS10]|uniref:Major facilitator superfamily (MFS) profile domain-containing protein n=1 Tax=Wolfiporia cocos (strain MD-104) TaxID=742152 RepID=A0A2H3JJU5_WOLCO|nr:hypothetical protein WOLCODRAFT_17732 [Wolfiporia cocos MD-104 SS10]
MANPDPTHVEDAASLDKGQQYGNLTALAQAAATDKSLSAFQGARVYWKATFWCLFMCMGALLWGYDSQVSGGLLSVPSFRRDFGFYDASDSGDYILAARWQSAFNSISSVGGMFGGDEERSRSVAASPSPISSSTNGEQRDSSGRDEQPRCAAIVIACTPDPDRRTRCLGCGWDGVYGAKHALPRKLRGTADDKYILATMQIVS